MPDVGVELSVLAAQLIVNEPAAWLTLTFVGVDGAAESSLQNFTNPP